MGQYIKSYEKEVFKAHMKILIATPLYPPDIGGPATYSKILFDVLPQRGIEVEVLSFGKVRMYPKVIRHMFYFFQLVQSGIQSNVIFAQDPVSVGIPAACAAFFLRKIFILKIVGDYAWEQGVQRFGVAELLDDFSCGKGHYPWQVAILKKLQNFSVRRAQIIIVPSQYLKKIVMRWGAPPDKIKVVYNSFEAPREILSKDEARRRCGLDGHIIISVGRLVPWKGFHELILLMSSLVAQVHDLKLVIIGDGPQRKELESESSKTSVSDHIIFTGSLPKEMLLIFLAAADVFALPTSYEGFSHQILEAMTVGLPVVTTFVGGNPEIIHDGVDGYLLLLGERNMLMDRIIALLKNPLLAREIGIHASKRVKDFSQDRMLQETVDVIKNA